MSMQDDVATTWRLVTQGGGWRAWAALLGLVLMVGGLLQWRTMLAGHGRRCQ